MVLSSEMLQMLFYSPFTVQYMFQTAASQSIYIPEGCTAHYLYFKIPCFFSDVTSIQQNHSESVFSLKVTFKNLDSLIITMISY